MSLLRAERIIYFPNDAEYLFEDLVFSTSLKV